MDIQVLKGNPTDDELAALTQVLTELKDKHSPSPTADANGWGAAGPRHHRATLYNPHAFGSTGYF